MRSRPPSTPAIRRDIEEFLARQRTASLGTVDGRGRAHAANVWYVHDARWRLYFVSNPHSAHSRHIARRGTAALTIYADVARPDQIRGLQIHGRVAAVRRRAEWRRAFALLARKHPFVLAVAAIRERVEAQSFYRVTPTWIRWIDNRRGFGFQREIRPG